MTTATFETAGDPQLFGNEPRNQSIASSQEKDRSPVLTLTSPLVLSLSPLLSSSTPLHLLLILSAPITTAIKTLIKITINMSEVIVDESGADSPLTTPTDQLEKCATDQNAKTAG
ncbi:hypothetical protein DTO169E5_2267 [Paecilomyces variotii]|nr:hypothetical protein DTO169E5_2267 [Paecilomyces variotii]